MKAPRWIFEHVVYRGALATTGQYSLYDRKASLEEQQFWTGDRLGEYRNMRLREVLGTALRDVPFYRDLSSQIGSVHLDGESLADPLQLLGRFPIVSKQTLRGSSNELRTEPFLGRTLSKTTGGSTGEPVTILKNAGAMAQERAAMWLAYGWFGVEIGDRCMRFWGVPRGSARRWTSRLGDIAMNRRRASSFSFSDKDLGEYWKTLRRFSPHYLHGYASMLVQMAVYGEKEGFGPPSADLKSIVATAEVLSDVDKSRLERVFGAPVQIEYGCGEVGPIAYSCEQGGLHQLQTNVHVEIVDDFGKPAKSGRLVITDLHNTAMPLIRYDVGDLGSWGADCTCEKGFPLLEGVHGRAYDIVTSPDGSRFHGEFFMYMFEDIEREGGSVDQFQVAQTATSELTVRIVTSSQDWGAQKRLVVDKFSERLPGFSVGVEKVEKIDRLPSGKMQVVSSFEASTGRN